MDLWRHQIESIELARQSQAGPTSRVLVQLPPGTGKTEVAVRCAVEWVKGAAFRRVLIAVPTAPILQQYHRRLSALTRLPIGVEKAGRFAKDSDKIVLASQATLWNRIGRYSAGTLFILDECHHSNYDAPENLRLIQEFDHVLGLSATPWSDGCHALFSGSGYYFMSLRQAQDLGLAARCELRPWEAPRGPWGLVFCSTNRECARASASHPGSAWIGIDLPYATVAQRVRAWHMRRIPVLYVNRMLLEGFDEPRCSEVWLAKPCDSQIMIVQMVGRALRYAAGKVASIYCASEQLESSVRASLARLDTPTQ